MNFAHSSTIRTVNGPGPERGNQAGNRTTGRTSKTVRMTKTPKPYGPRDSTPMTPRSSQR
jgi:hypothetical protein